MSSHLKIAEYAEPPSAFTDILRSPPILEQTVIDFTTGTQTSAPFNAATRFIVVTVTASCAVFVGGTTPVATVNSQFMPAGGFRVFAVNPGDALSVIADS